MPQTIPFEPRELETYKNSYELILVVRDALAGTRILRQRHSSIRG